jgi:hypothetical protein
MTCAGSPKDPTRMGEELVAERFDNDLWTINIDGTGLTNITNTSGGFESELYPDWGVSLSN